MRNSNDTKMVVEQLEKMGFSEVHRKHMLKSIQVLLQSIKDQPAFLPDEDSVSCEDLLEGDGKYLSWVLQGSDQETTVYKLEQNGVYKGIKLFVLQANPQEDREYSFMFYTDSVPKSEDRVAA